LFLSVKEYLSLIIKIFRIASPARWSAVFCVLTVYDLFSISLEHPSVVQISEKSSRMKSLMKDMITRDNSKWNLPPKRSYCSLHRFCLQSLCKNVWFEIFQWKLFTEINVYINKNSFKSKIFLDLLASNLESKETTAAADYIVPPRIHENGVFVY